MAPVVCRLIFALLSSSDAKKRLCDSQKVLDKRCCAYQRRKEATFFDTIMDTALQCVGLSKNKLVIA
jgi:hypothetical protein